MKKIIKKKLPTFLLASHFFVLAQTPFFFKITFQKKLPTKPRRANIGPSLGKGGGETKTHKILSKKSKLRYKKQ